jgi:hypothetical protein
MENRRDFFKALGIFTAGVVGAKVSSYIPKKKEEKEELMVSEHICVTDSEGKVYNVVVVPKQEIEIKQYDSSSLSESSNERIRITSNGVMGIKPPEFKVRKLNNNI